MAGLRNLCLAMALSAGTGTAEPVTIAALGDSLTAGYGLFPGNGFVPQMEAWLKARGIDATIINAGVSGDTTQGGLNRFDWTVTPEVDAMIVALGGNDLLRGIDPAVSRANLDAILQKAQAADLEVLLIGLRASSNYGMDFKRAFDAMYPDLSRKYDTLYVDSFFLGLRDLPEGTAPYMLPDGIHPNAKGVARIVDALGPKVMELARKAQVSPRS